MITPGDRVADVARDLVEGELGRLEVDAGHRGQRPVPAAVERERVGRGDRALDRDRRQRLAQGEVEVDRAGADLTARPRSARQATERRWSRPMSSASWVPTSQNQRTASPKVLIWSIVWPAPIRAAPAAGRR